MPSDAQQDPVPIADVMPDLGRSGANPYASSGYDWQSVTAAYMAACVRIDAVDKYTAFADQNPTLTETDWTRPQYGENRAAIDAVIGWQVSKRGILASGPTGRGKTRAIVQLFRRLARDEGRDVRYYHANDWFASLQQQVNYGRDEARGWVQAVAERPMVMIDDLGQEAMQAARKQWAEAWFFRFLDIRIARGLPLIISTNLSARDMASGTSGIRSDPMLRRLLELCAVVKFQ